MAVTIYGTNDVVKTGYDKDWSQDGKQTVAEVWTGPIAKAEAKYDALVAALGSDTVSIRRSKGVGIVSVRVSLADGGGDDDSTSGVWQIGATVLDKPLESFPGLKEVPAIKAFNLAADRVAIALANSEYEKGNFQFVPAAEPAKTYFGFKVRGVQSYLRGIPTVRWCRTVNKANSAVKASYAGVDRAWKITDPNGPKNMPAEMKTALAELDEWNANKKQWLKQWPTLETSDNTNYQLVHSWMWARRWAYTFYNGDGLEDE